MDLNIERTKYAIMQFCYECLTNARNAIEGYNEASNTEACMQFMNQAYTNAKMIYLHYLQICDRGEIQIFEDFYHQFLFLNSEFLEAVRTDHSLQHSHQELDLMQERYDDLKQSLGH